MIHLDTSFLVRALNPASPECRRLFGWLRSGETPVISAVAWTEFLCGPAGEPQKASVGRLLGRRQDYTTECAETAARLFNEAGRRRGSLADCMVAAVALTADAPLATADRRDFARFTASGLRLVGSDAPPSSR